MSAALLLAACNSDDIAVPDTVATTTTTTTEPPRTGNGQLTIGVLLPTTGPGAQLGQPMIGAVRLAVDRINEAGGVFGEPVRLVEADEGASVSSATLGFDTLLAEEVDAIVGPASSLAALGALDHAVSAGVLTCSPTATSLALDNFPDNGLFFRTAPSDSLQAVVIAQLAEQTGSATVSIFYIDDAYGRGLADAVESAVASSNLSVSARVGLPQGESEVATLARDVVADEPGVVVVLGDADRGTRMLSALADVAETWMPSKIIVNDSLRTARASQRIVDLPDDIRSRIEGVAPLSAPADNEHFTGAFSAHAFDCVNLIALAAMQAGSDAPERIATQMSAVSVGGSVCRSFAACADRIADGLQLDYNGVSGDLNLSARGDPRRARFELFRFDEDGRDETVGSPLDVAVT
jgi:branched-chain amino acid transport system substrate-binding protein